MLGKMRSSMLSFYWFDLRITASKSYRFENVFETLFCFLFNCPQFHHNAEKKVNANMSKSSLGNYL